LSHNDSVSQWIEALGARDEAAAAKLWQRYYRRLVALAWKKLRDAPRRVADEEDVVLSAFRTFCQRAREKQFPNLRDRNDLWQLIVRITERKAYDQLRAQNRKKRGGGRVAGESVLAGCQASESGAGIHGVAGPEPTPEFAAEAAEAMEGLLARLDDEELREIALLKLQGFTNEEIAARIGRALPTVERRLRLIRQTWKEEAADE
jgi:RNA polymerase sigma factor (sigma-70 family)